MRKLLIASLLAAASLTPLALSSARAGDYLQAGVDSGRTGWIKDDAVLSKSNVGSMHQLWKIKLPSVPRQMHNLFPPLVAGSVATPSGNKEVVIITDVSNHIWALDAATGQQLWTKAYVEPKADAFGAGSTLCPGGSTSVPVMAKKANGGYSLYFVDWGGSLHTIDVATGDESGQPQPFVMANSKPYSLNLFDGKIYTVNAQSCGGNPNAMESFDLATRRASIMLPRGGGMWGREGVAIDNAGNAYIGTGDGPYEPQLGTLGNAIVVGHVDNNDTLQLVNWYSPRNANWMYKRDQDINTSPLVLNYKGQDFVFGSSKECRVWMLPALGSGSTFGGADHRTTQDTSKLICNDYTHYDLGVWGALAGYVDPAGTGWLYAPFWGPESVEMKAAMPAGNHPTHGGVIAFKLTGSGATTKMQPAWFSQDMLNGETALVDNGMVITYGSGEDVRQQGLEFAYNDQKTPAALKGITAQTDRRIANSTHATIYILDAATGQTLWNSGDDITSFSHFSGITAANGKLYFPSFDGYLYAYGVR